MLKRGSRVKEIEKLAGSFSCSGLMRGVPLVHAVKRESALEGGKVTRNGKALRGVGSALLGVDVEWGVMQ